ncbi:uncharacterized protein LOC141621725 [Silene latifolia]|uniref:uncharacterized protein LOC141621725 n=1 Tax=Silene latifolia TaxID=37657 RepID=UPI003D785C90
MLVVFCLRDNIAYIFDSDKATKKTWQIKSCLSWAWKRYSFRAGTRDMLKKNELQIKMIECPQQPGNYECGYYVIKWMYDITVRYALSEDGIQKCVSGAEITIEQMNEVRELWSLYCVKNV